MADEIDAAKLIVRLFRMIEPIAAVVPDLERLGSVRAVEDEAKARVAVIERKESEAQARLAESRTTDLSLKAAVMQRRSEDKAAADSVRAEAKRLVESARAEAAKLIADAKIEAAELDAGATSQRVAETKEYDAGLRDLLERVAATRENLDQLTAQAGEAQARLDAIKAAAREFAGK